MNKTKLFLENFLIYGIGGIISKVIPLIMVPIITRLMPNTEYFGISDLQNTLVSFTSAIALMGMYDAMYRMFFDKDDEIFKYKICSTTLFFSFFMALLVSCILMIFRKQISSMFFGDEKYTILISLSALGTFITATNGIVAAPTRMQNKRKIFLLTNTISPLISYGIAIPLLLKGMYVIALPLAIVISGFILEITFYLLNKKWFSFKNIDLKLLKQLLPIALPLMPNFIIYWVFNSSDKIMITNILGIGEAGIYSVGSKLGHASQLIYTAFAGGWQYFAFSTMKDNNQVKDNSLIFEYLGLISFVSTMFICVFGYTIYKVLFDSKYIDGFIISPYLFIAPLLMMLYQVIGNQFLVIKKTWISMLVLTVGMIVNVIMNLILIPRIGIEGAAIATLLGYLFSLLICIIILINMNLMTLRIKFIFVFIIFILFMICWRFYFTQNILYGCITTFICILVYILLYRKDFIRLIYNRKNQ